jgi:hypothetical protein
MALSLSGISSGWRETQNRMILCGILDLCRLLFGIVVDPFRRRKQGLQDQLIWIIDELAVG